jgi:hypothetical protein
MKKYLQAVTATVTTEKIFSFTDGTVQNMVPHKFQDLQGTGESNR